MSLTKVWIHGISGRVGELLTQKLSKRRGFDLLGGSTKSFHGSDLDGSPVDAKNLAETLRSCQMVFDFSTAQANALLLEAFKTAGLKEKFVLIGTTQIPEPQLKAWQDLAKASKLHILLAPNTSIGIFLLSEALQNIAPLCRQLGFDIEMVETHHNKKMDAPSGTALKLAATINDSLDKPLTVHTHYDKDRPAESLGIHSVRAGGVFGEHEVRFISEDEELYFGHKALNRGLFAEGAITLAGWLMRQPVGFYQLKDVQLKSLL